jgi:hypothetical protein
MSGSRRAAAAAPAMSVAAADVPLVTRSFACRRLVRDCST